MKAGSLNASMPTIMRSELAGVRRVICDTLLATAAVAAAYLSARAAGLPQTHDSADLVAFISFPLVFAFLASCLAFGSVPRAAPDSPFQASRLRSAEQYACLAVTLIAAAAGLQQILLNLHTPGAVTWITIWTAAVALTLARLIVPVALWAMHSLQPQD